MQHDGKSESRPVVIVVGCDEVGSAVAHGLHDGGYAVVLVDAIDPPWIRRGMAFTDAWYIGSATLSGTSAVFCASVRSIPAVLDRYAAIAATTWSCAGVASVLAPVAMIETRAPSLRRAPPDRRTVPVLTIEVVPGAIAGPEFDIAIAAPIAEPRSSMRVVHAEAAGWFATARGVGEFVRAGDALGVIGGKPIIAPLGGCLRGLAARGARIHAGAAIAEIDPLGDPARCFGLEPRSRAIADAVRGAVAVEATMPYRGTMRDSGASAAP